MIDLVLYCVCGAFQYSSGAELNKKLHSLPPHAKEELQFGSILFHINLQSLHNLYLCEWVPVTHMHKQGRPTDTCTHKADRLTNMHTQGRPTDTHAHTRQTDRHTCTYKADGPTHMHTRGRPTDTHAHTRQIDSHT